MAGNSQVGISAVVSILCVLLVVIASPVATVVATAQPQAQPAAAVTFDAQTVQDGSTSVNVASATFNGTESFNIVVHQAIDSDGDGEIEAANGEIGKKIGESAELESGTSTDIPVNISKQVADNGNVSQLTENQTLIAMLHTTNTSDGDNIVSDSSIKRDGTPVFDQADITVAPLESAAAEFDADNDRNIDVAELADAGAAFVQGDITIADLGTVGTTFAQSDSDSESGISSISRSLSTTDIAPSETVTLTTELTGASGSVSTSSGYDPQVSSATVQSVTVNGASVDPIISEATVNGSTVILGDVGTDATVTITEELIVGSQLNVTHSITGDVTAGGQPTDFEAVSVTVGGVSTPPPEEVDVDPNDLPGSGSESNPYEISNASELQAMEDDLDANYELVSDIDVSNTAQFNDGRGFDPVGSFNNQFTGSFDGNDRTVTGLTIDRPNEVNVGLFGESSGTVRNITLTNTTITGDFHVGGLIGQNDENGTIRRATASGNVSGFDNVGGLVGENDGIVRDVRAFGSVTGTDFGIGGLVGHNDVGTIRNARASGSVTGGDILGGLVGFNGNFDSDREGGIIANARASGNADGVVTIGGLVGLNGGTIQDTFAVGSVTGSVDVGGLVGVNREPVEESYFDTQTTGQNSSPGSATGLTTTQMQGQPARTNMSGFDFNNTWTTTDEYPALRALSETDEGSGGGGGGGGPIQIDVDPSDLPGDGSASAPYEIANASELQAMEGDLDANYELVSDIDASQTAQFNNGSGFDPVGDSVSDPFTGSFDGNDHTITGLTIDRTGEDDLGLFGVTGNEATLTDVTLSSVMINDGDQRVGRLVGNNLENITDSTTSGSVNGPSSVGGLVGANNGNITDSTASGSVNGDLRVGGLVGFNAGNIADSTASGSVNGSSRVGGLVGNNLENITDSTASGSVTGTNSVGGLVGIHFDNITDSTASGSVSGDRSVGGLVGINDGDVTVAQASGTVDGTLAVGGLVGNNTGTIQNATASGSVTGGDRVGGLVGGNRGSIRNATASGAVTGNEDVGGLVGQNLGRITIARASGDVTGEAILGGLVGFNGKFGGSEGNVLIRKATASGSVTSVADVGVEGGVGGLVGSNTETIQNASARGTVVKNNTASFVNAGGAVGEHDDGTIQETFAVGPVRGDVSRGGLVGDRGSSGGTIVDSYWDTQATTQSNSAGSAIGLTTAQMQGTAAVNNMSGFAFGTTWRTQTDPDDYPALIALQGLTQSQPEPLPLTSITFENQTVLNGSTTVTVDSAQFGNQSVPGEDFVVVAHETTFDGGIGTKIGESAILEGNQTQSNITVDLAKQVTSTDDDDVAQLTEQQQLVAMLHTAQTGDGDNINHGTNDLSADTPPPVTARAQVTPLGLQTIETNITDTGNSLNQPGQPVTLTATVPNDGATTETIQLTVINDNEQLNTTNLTVSPGQTETVSVTVSPTQTETLSIQGPASTQTVTIDVAELSLIDATLVTQEPVTTTDVPVVTATVTNTGTATGVIPLRVTTNSSVSPSAPDNATVLNLTTQEIPPGETVSSQLIASDPLGEGTQTLTVRSSLQNQTATVGDVAVARPPAITNATVRVGSGSLGPGGTTDVNLTLDQAPEGLAGYNLTASVSLAETSGVTVTDATAPAVFNNSVTETTIGPTNQTVEIRATDINTAVEQNATNILLGTVTVVATETATVSQTNLTVSVSRIDDDRGTPINVTTQSGTVTVTEQPPLAEGLNPPTDPDNDGVFEDVNGNGRLDFNDVVILFENLPDAEAPFQDLNDNGRIDFDDIVELFKEI